MKVIVHEPRKLSKRQSTLGVMAAIIYSSDPAQALSNRSVVQAAEAARRLLGEVETFVDPSTIVDEDVRREFQKVKE